MGRLSTFVAARAANADNLPAQLPNISTIDALLPRSLTSSKEKKKPITPNKPKSGSVAYSEVRKNSSGRLLLVNHKQKAVAGPAEPKDDDKANDKQGKGKNTKGGASADEKKDEASKKQDEGTKKGNGGDDQPAFTAEQDAKLKELMAADASWRDCAKEMKCSQAKLKLRWEEIKPAGANAPGGGGDNKPADAEFTSEEDEKLKELKASNTSWKDIANEMERTQGQLKKRWNEIKPDAATDCATGKKDGANATKQDSGDGGGGGKEGKGKGKGKPDQNKKKEAPVEIKAPSKPPSKAPSKAASRVHSKASSSHGHGETRFTMREWATLHEDDIFSFQELQLLIEVVAQDPDQSWLRVASVFADKTGRRVHPYDIRDKFERMRA